MTGLHINITLNDIWRQTTIETQVIPVHMKAGVEKVVCRRKTVILTLEDK